MERSMSPIFCWQSTVAVEQKLIRRYEQNSKRELHTQWPHVSTPFSTLISDHCHACLKEFCYAVKRFLRLRVFLTGLPCDLRIRIVMLGKTKSNIYPSCWFVRLSDNLTHNCQLCHVIRVGTRYNTNTALMHLSSDELCWTVEQDTKLSRLPSISVYNRPSVCQKWESPRSIYLDNNPE